MSLRVLIKKIPVLGGIAGRIYRSISGSSNGTQAFPGSSSYWEGRYASGGNSGVGSYNKFAEFKAKIINEFVLKQQIRTVVEFGSGDGNQLELARYPSYIGVDVSTTAIAACRSRFAADSTKSFDLPENFGSEKADLSLSLDVIYHLVEDDVFEQCMRQLFAAAVRFVIIYSSNTDENEVSQATHVRHRRFNAWIDHHLPEWKLLEHIPNRYPYTGDYKSGSFADFYIYCRA
jgi:hypothetical protein